MQIANNHHLVRIYFTYISIVNFESKYVKLKLHSNKKMDLVVVLLKSVQKKIIVPEYYINGYNQSFLKLLKNKGNNAGRDHLIYWSNDVVEGEFYPDPDQNAEELTHFPPQKDGWYRGRTLWFTGNIQFIQIAIINNVNRFTYYGV